jgi:hypothetical protein
MKMPSNSTIQDPNRKDPRSQGPKPEFAQETIPYPGSPDEMNPRPDHGEETYAGLGRLKNKVALITGADSGIGRAWPSHLPAKVRMLFLAICPTKRKTRRNRQVGSAAPEGRRFKYQAIFQVNKIVLRWPKAP